MAREELLLDHESEAIDDPQSESMPKQFVTFTCGERAFGVDIMRVREIRGWSPITELPHQPRWAVGVLDIRGNIVRVYDLRLLIGVQGVKGGTNLQVVLVVSIHNHDVGLLVDAVSDIIFAQGSDLRSAPATAGRAENSVLGLVRSGQGLIAIIDLGLLLPDEETLADVAYV